jgi:high-affinity iron transporter
VLRGGLQASAPAQDRAMRRALAAAARAAQARDGRALAAARGSARAAALGGAYCRHARERRPRRRRHDRQLAAAARLPHRHALHAPGADATTAVDRLAKRKLAPSAARLAIAKDLLDAYQARPARAAQGRRHDRREGLRDAAAESAAQAAGYWQILAPRYREDRGAAATAAAAREFADLRASAARGDRRGIAGARAEIDTALDGFTAAPFTPAESARRAQQLLRFVALVPVEYGRGVKDGRVTLDFEVQEAIAFQTASDGALGDLRDQLASATRPAPRPAPRR